LGELLDGIEIPVEAGLLADNGGCITPLLDKETPLLVADPGADGPPGVVCEDCFKGTVVAALNDGNSLSSCILNSTFVGCGLAGMPTRVPIVNTYVASLLSFTYLCFH